jgi:phage N-6-adenine-methyltransferase
LPQHRQHRPHTKDDWRTPIKLFNKLNGRFSFTGDACASSHNALCQKFFTEDSDAISSDWSELGDRVFMNPPYSKCHEFMARAWRAVRDKEVDLVVALVPSTCEVKWFHEFVLGKATEIWFTKGRVNFINPSTDSAAQSNVIGSAVVVWDGARVGWSHTSMWGLSSKTFEPTGPVSGSVWGGDRQLGFI